MDRLSYIYFAASRTRAVYIGVTNHLRRPAKRKWEAPLFEDQAI